MLNKQDKAHYLRLLSFVRPHWKIVALSLFATLIFGLTEPLVPYVMQPLIDGGFAKQNMQTVYLMVGILVAGFFVRGLANFTSAYTSTWIAQRVVYTLRAQMFDKMLHLPMRYFDQNTNGSILSRFTYDVVQLMSATTDSLIILFRDGITILALLFYLFYLDWRLSMTLMIAAPFLSWIIISVSRKLRHAARNLQADMGKMNHVVDEALHARAIIRIFNGFAHETQRFDAQAKSVERYNLRSRKVSILASPILEMIIITALSAVIIIAAHKAQVDASEMTAGKFVAFLGTMALLFPPMKRIGRTNEPIQRGLAAMQSIFDFLDEPNEQPQLFATKTIQNGDIRFENVSFSYHDQCVLKDFNLTIKAGESVALVGESGSGKSTIAALLAGFYQPDQGDIFIDNQKMSDTNMCDRRQAMAYVSQETVLFSGSILQNIAYADPNPDEQRAIEAAKSANADGFIREFAEGYQAHIGQYGGRLSGGQKQRIAIARALYKDAPILILDEATSALDNQSEQKVQEAIERLQKGRTSLIIAHRLSTIEHADRIVVLQKGKIVESGDHQSLLKAGGIYAKLVSRSQS